ncbi:MAG: carbohydrate kinase family protein, partial [Patescibacteria group bacterium]|nr:carbohydrate kinase family protein [Patescibacteria group bacterium]
MSIIITGSVAYNNILNFPGSFSKRLHLDDVHVLNAFFYLDRSVKMFGGSAGNIAYTLKLLGEEPGIIAAVGDDFDQYRTRLESMEISTNGIRQYKGEETASATIIVDQEDNQIIAFFPGAARHGIELDIPHTSKNQDALLVIAAAPPPVIVKRYTEAIRHKIPYIFAPGHAIGGLTKTELRDGYRNSLVTLFNDYEWRDFQARANKQLSTMLEQGVTVAITRGDAGSMVYTRDQEYFIPIAKRAKLVSPYGAGDAYMAGMVYGITRAWDWQVIGQVASVAASFAVESYGPQEHMFTQEV